MSLVAVAVYATFFILMIEISGIRPAIVELYRENGLGTTIACVTGAVGFVFVFISTLWILSACGLY